MKKLVLVFSIIFTLNSCSTKDEKFSSDGLRQNLLVEYITSVLLVKTIGKK